MKTIKTIKTMKTINLFIATFVLLLSVSCSNDEPSQETKDVYVAGVELNTSTKRGMATLWKNGVATNLTNGTNAAGAQSVYVYGKDVYVAGQEYNGKYYKGMLWKNGVATDITDGSRDAFLYSVFVSGNDVYLAGQEGGQAKIWKNGVATQLSSIYSSSYTKAYSVTVSGNDVFVAGVEGGFAKLWKNGDSVGLFSASIKAGAAKSVFATGTSVYVAGNLSNLMTTAILWREDGVGTDLSDGNAHEYANSVFVQGKDVYVAGYKYDDVKGKDVLKLWKNGIASEIATDARPQSLFVSDSDVYIAGNDSDGGKLWINGVHTKFGNNYTELNSVFVSTSK